VFFSFANAQSGKWDFSTELGESSSSGNAIFFGVLYILAIIFGGSGVRHVLLTFALGLAAFSAYAFALYKIGSALQVWTLGDSPKNREGLLLGLFVFIVGWGFPLYIFGKRNIDGTSNRKNNIQLAAIFASVLFLFVCSFVFLNHFK
jgi:glucan phosphoethanolaminetransferase (alkaline phosphatase superfamily)